MTPRRVRAGRPRSRGASSPDVVAAKDVHRYLCLFVVPLQQPMERVDRAEQVPCLLDKKAWSLAVRGVVLVAADRLEGMQGRGAADEQDVEEVPQAGQGLVRGRAGAREFVDDAAGQDRRDPGELEGLPLAPGKKAAHDTAVGAGSDWGFPRALPPGRPCWRRLARRVSGTGRFLPQCRPCP